MPKSDSRKSENRKFAVAKRSLNTEWGLKAPTQWPPDAEEATT